MPANNIDKNHNFSILIPTYNRQKFLKRILSYYDSFKEGFNIVIADSSTDENKQENQKTISTLSNLTITYIGFPPNDDYLSIMNKILGGLNNTKTKYCVFCADDDFITPTGIKQSVEFLENNPGYTVAHGHYIVFSVKADADNQFQWKPYTAAGTIADPTPEARLFHHLSSYTPTFYGVHNTNLLKLIFEETLDFADDFRFSELLASVIALIYGKCNCLSVFYAAREISTDSTSLKIEPFKNIISSQSYTRKYNKFRECLSMHLMKKSQTNLKQAEELIDNSMKNYLIKYNFISNDGTSNLFSNIKDSTKNHSIAFFNERYSEFREEINKIISHTLSYSGDS